MAKSISDIGNIGKDAGFAYSFAGVEIRLGTSVFSSIGSLKHNQEIERAVVHGAGMAAQRVTVGQLKEGAGSFKFTDLADLGRFQTQLAAAGGLYLAKFPLVASYSAPGRPTYTVELVDCMINDFPFEGEAGPEALTVDVPIMFMRRRLNGLDLIPKNLQDAAVKALVVMNQLGGL